jgi:PadR family transcriptional regulator PadR
MNDALRVSVEPVILALLGQQPDHGYSLMLRIRATMGVDLSDGSLYPTLKRLEESGRIEGSWESPPGERRRKVFHLTDEGRSTLNRARVYWPELAQRLNRLLLPTPNAEPVEVPAK